MSQRVWRRRVGWILLGLALVVFCAGLPVWGLATTDLDKVAGWANILALSVSVVGLFLVFADRNWSRVIRGSAADRRPWMAPPLDRMVPRPELAERLLTELVVSVPAVVGLTTTLEGAGGFGKSRLATWACHQPEVERRFPGGLLWVTVGQDVHGADLAGRINDLAYSLSGQQPTLSDPDTAGAELGRLLDEREPALLVIDDVWSEPQLKPFRIGGRSCTRLITTRIPGLLPSHYPSIRVDAMSSDQARQLVAYGLPELSDDSADRLADLAGRWPVLLNLINGVLYRRVKWHQSPDDAALEVERLLHAEGPVALDPAQPAERDRAVASTVDASLALLHPDDQHRTLALAIFPEDVDIPLTVLAMLWPDCRVDDLCADLVRLGLVVECRLDPPGPRLVVHDVIRAYLRTRLDPREQSRAHQRLIAAASKLLPRNSEPPAWWRLPADASYLWRYLAYHLREAGQTTELATLACDLRWVEAKTLRFGSVVLAIADLQLVDTPTARTLRRILQQTAHVLSPIDPPTALGQTLACRLHGVPGLTAVLDRYLATLPTPRLLPAWPLPDQPDDVERWRSAGHAGAVTNCGFSPDGALLATTSDDRTARLWNVTEHTTQAVLSGHTGAVWACAFSPDGTLLATASDDNALRLWQIPTGAEVGVLRGHADGVTACAFSPDGTVLATASNDQTVRLWRIPDGTELPMLAGELAAGARRCVFSPDGKRLAIALANGTVQFWQIAGATKEMAISCANEQIRDCAFSPDGSLLATASYRTVRLWEVASGHEIAVLPAQTSWIWTCAFSPDGTLLATGNNDTTAKLWHVATRTQQAVLAGDIRKVNNCGFSPDGKLLATTGVDDTVQLWQAASGSRHQTLIGHRGRANRCEFSPDGQLLATTSNDHTVRLWSVANGTTTTVLTGHTGTVGCCAFSPAGTLLITGSSDLTARIWNVNTGRLLQTLTGHRSRIKACAFSPDGTLVATASNDNSIRLWHLADGSVTILSGHTDMINTCAFSPNGAFLATASDDRTVRLWNIDTKTEHATLTGHTAWVESCSFSPDGTLLATASNDGTIRLWKLPAGQCHCALRVDSPISAIAWHPNATTLCAVGGAGIYLFNYQR